MIEWDEADGNRMGGPRAWKEMQKKQQESNGGWDDQHEQVNNNDDDDDEEDDVEKIDVEKRDLYAEYDVDPETENEKSQRQKGVGDTGELPGQEDVCLHTSFPALNLTCSRSLRWP